VVGEPRGDGTKGIAGRVGGKVKRMIPRTNSRCSEGIQSRKGRRIPILEGTAHTYVASQESRCLAGNPGRVLCSGCGEREYGGTERVW